jgi:hypothetical protein
MELEGRRVFRFLVKNMRARLAFKVPKIPNYIRSILEI